MKNTLETRLGIFFALALIVAFIIMEVVGGFDIFRGGRHVRARFDSVQELKEGDPVKMAGVEIGRVEEIRIGDNKVEVSMKVLDRRAALKTDSQATIKFAGLMGQYFVAISFGSTGAPDLAENEEIASVEQPDLAALMGRLEKVADGVERMTASFSGDSFEKLLAPLADFVKENSPRLTAILGSMQSISSQVAEGRGTIGKLIYDEAFYNSAFGAVTNLSRTADDIQATIAEAHKAVSEINQGKGTLGKLAKDEALYQETTTAMTSLREILQKINQGQGSVGKLVNDDSFYKNMKLSLQKLDKATEGLEDQGPLSILGVVVSSLF